MFETNKKKAVAFSFNLVAVPLFLILCDYLLIAEAFLEFCQTSMMEIYCENS